MQRAGPQIIHLAYADDVMIFTSGSKISPELVMQQLSKYERCSRQSINSAKSCFLVNPKAELEHISEIKIITGFRHIEFSTS